MFIFYCKYFIVGKKSARKMPMMVTIKQPNNNNNDNNTNIFICVTNEQRNQNKIEEKNTFAPSRNKLQKIYVYLTNLPNHKCVSPINCKTDNQNI